MGQAAEFAADVNLLHRLLKNDVAMDTGITAHAMFTQGAVDALGLGPLTEGMIQL
jgi:hypothetical protein